MILTIPTAWSIFINVFKRHIKLASKKHHGIVHSVMFIILSLLLFKIATNASHMLYHGVMQFILLFSLLFSLDDIIYDDYCNTMFDQILLKGVMLEIALVAKIIAHIVILIIPFAIILPLIAYILYDMQNVLGMMMALLLMSINILLVLTFCSTLCLGYNKSGIVMLTALPFTVPSVVLSSLSMHDTVYMWLALAILMFSAPICIIASAVIVRYVLRCS